MIYFNNKNTNIRLNVLFINIIFIALIVTSLFLGFSDNFRYPDPFAAIIFAIGLLVLEQLVVYLLWYKRIRILSDNFMRYKYCKGVTECNCQVDSMFNNIFRASPDMITFKDAKLRYVLCSKKFLDFFSFKTDSEVVGKTQSEVFKNSNAESSDKYLAELLVDKVAKTYIQRFYKNNVEYIYESISSPIIKENDVIGILTLSRDITETISLKKSLEYSNSKLYTLINNSPQLAYVLDTDGNIIMGNARARVLFLSGVDVTNSGEKIKFDVERMKKHIIRENLDLIKSGKGLTTEIHVPDENGEMYWYSVKKTPVKDADGKFYAVATFARNIDAEKRIQEQRETYIATLSHDLKTPAIAQVRALELLLSGQLGEFNDEQKEILKLTLDSCNYMYEMVYTLLSTCKFESGEVVLNYKTFDFVTLVNECIFEMSNLTKENSVVIEFLPAVKELIINADKIELKRVVINLLSNAINYAFPSTAISVKIDKIGDSVQLLVKNSSSYIEPEVMSKLFRKYITHSEKFNKVGMGLGLYLSKKIVEAHNGKIIAESFKNQSNVFGFNIPIVVEKSSISEGRKTLISK